MRSEESLTDLQVQGPRSGAAQVVQLINSHTVLVGLSNCPVLLSLRRVQVQFQAHEDHRFSFTGDKVRLSDENTKVTPHIQNILYNGRQGFRMGGLDTTVGNVQIFEWVCSLY